MIAKEANNKNITVIGIGKLGLGFALLLERSGYNVLGVDIFQDYVNRINEKTIYFSEPQYDTLLQKSNNLRATTSLQEGLNHSNIIFIIVQTPNGGGSRFYDHSILSNLLEKINKLKPQDKHFIIGCTVMPNYIQDIGKQLINHCKNITLSYNPEFVAQGDIVRGFENPDIILVGTESEELKSTLKEIYDRMTTNQPKYCFMKPTEAEIVKISLNGFITTKISFANMISDLCDTLHDVNKATVLDAIGSDSRIGTKYFRPGTSFGGPCFPRDTKALKQLMDQNGIQSNILKATTEYNEEHIRFQTYQLLSEDTNISNKMQEILTCDIIPFLTEDAENNLLNQSISTPKLCDRGILNENRDNRQIYRFSNVCYKDNSKIPIIEESAKLKIAERLSKLYNKKVMIRDVEPIINEVKKEYGSLFNYEIE
jgi:nucleotide sugar dehydrogenase